MIPLSLRLALLVVAAASALPVRAAAPAGAFIDAHIEASINLAGAIRLALDQPGVRAASHEVAASDALVGQAGRLPNPELAWLREGQQAGARTTTLQINQPIELGGKRAARIALAQGEAEVARSTLLARRREVRAAVIAGYYELLVARRKLDLARALTGLAAQTVDVAGKRVAAGKASPIDATRARLAAADATAALTQAQADVAVAGARLAGLTGLGGQAGARIGTADDADRVPDAPPLDALLAGAAHAPAVRLARSERTARAAQVDVARAARMPDLTLSAGTQRDDGVGRRQAVFGIALPLPLFDRNAGNLAAALRRSDRAADELAAAAADTIAQVTAAHARYAAARRDADLLRQDVAPQAQHAYEQTLKGFEYGKFAFLDVLDAQRTWFQVQARRWDSTLAACRAYAELERLAGTADTQ
jgi:cobalt-zinc-cadmium efflux system outer membrane protein